MVPFWPRLVVGNAVAMLFEGSQFPGTGHESPLFGEVKPVQHGFDALKSMRKQRAEHLVRQQIHNPREESGISLDFLQGGFRPVAVFAAERPHALGGKSQMNARLTEFIQAGAQQPGGDFFIHSRTPVSVANWARTSSSPALMVRSIFCQPIRS